MKKKICLAGSLCLMLFFQIDLFAQNECDSIPISHIGDAIARSRIGFFDTVKKNIIKPNPKKPPAVDSITIADKREVIKILNKIKGSKKYDGIRIYFAITDQSSSYEKNRLTLVLIPTIESGIVGGGDDDEMSDDDSTNVYVLEGGKFSPARDITSLKN